MLVSHKNLKCRNDEKITPNILHSILQCIITWRVTIKQICIPAYLKWQQMPGGLTEGCESSFNVNLDSMMLLMIWYCVWEELQCSFKEACHSGSVSATDEPQQEEEQEDNVQIEVEGSKHILLRRQFILPVFPTQDKLGIKHQVLRRDRERSEMLQHYQHWRLKAVRLCDERDREPVTRIGLKENTGSISYLWKRGRRR